VRQAEADLAWRQAGAPLVAALAPLEAETRVTLGLREQSALARETALAVASCIAHHRDVSLNF